MSLVRNSIFEIYPKELITWAESKGLPKFRAEQLLQWIFVNKVFSPEQMSNVPKDVKQSLTLDFDWTFPEIVSKLDSEDGATKLLLKSEKGHLIETVILRYENRISLCVSSQVGCKMACSFCQTGKLGFFRNLSAAEIMAQFTLAQSIVKPEGRFITHVVFMGMGEPLDNYDHVIKSVNLMIEGYGLNPKNVTISTSGIVPKLLTLADDTKASLAVSLHAAREDLRTELMPINRKYPLSELKEALLHYQAKTGRRMTFEYILIKDKNTSLKEAKELIKFLHGFKAKVNLIPFNHHPGLEYDKPFEETIRAFQKYISDRSYPAPVRYSKGLDISGACGQLAAKKIESLEALPQRKSALFTSVTS